MRRNVVAVIAGLIMLAGVPAHAGNPQMRVTLLGTAGPEYFPDRLGISTLVEANGERLLFDVGRGTNQRLYQSRFNPKDISKIFLTTFITITLKDCPTFG
jgi:ribonuclease Z